MSFKDEQTWGWKDFPAFPCSAKSGFYWNHLPPFASISKINNAVWISRVYMINSIINYLWALYPSPFLSHIRRATFQQQRLSRWFLASRSIATVAVVINDLFSFPSFSMEIVCQDREMRVNTFTFLRSSPDDILYATQTYFALLFRLYLQHIIGSGANVESLPKSFFITSFRVISNKNNNIFRGN